MGEGVCGVHGFRGVGALGRRWSTMGCGVTFAQRVGSKPAKYVSREIEDEGQGEQQRSGDHSCLASLLVGAGLRHAYKDGGSCETFLVRVYHIS